MRASPISASTIGKEGVGGRSSVPVLGGDSEGGSHSVRPTRCRDLDRIPIKRDRGRGRKPQGIKWTADQPMDGCEHERKTERQP